MNKADKAKTVQPGEGSGESHQAEGKLHREWSKAFSVVPSNTIRAQRDTQEVPPEHEETLFVMGIAPGDCADYLYPWRYSKAIWTQCWSSGPS